jgi:hypothetical protein
MGLFDRLKENIRASQESSQADIPSTTDLKTTEPTTTEQSFLAKNKWWFIGGGVLLVGGIATFLILRRKN